MSSFAYLPIQIFQKVTEWKLRSGNQSNAEETLSIKSPIKKITFATIYKCPFYVSGLNWHHDCWKLFSAMLYFVSDSGETFYFIFPLLKMISQFDPKYLQPDRCSFRSHFNLETEEVAFSRDNAWIIYHVWKNLLKS